MFTSRHRALGVLLAASLQLGPSLAQTAPSAKSELKVQTWVHTRGGSWKLISSIFSRQTNKVLKVPSWTGTYEFQPPPGANRRGPGHTLTTTVYYFPTQDRTRDVMISPAGSGFKTDLKGQIPGPEESYGVWLQVTPGSTGEVPGGAEPGKHLIEVRCRKGKIVTTFAGRPIGVDLMGFATEFLRTNGILGEWKELAILIRATQGDKELYVKGSVATDEMYRGTIKLSSSESLVLEFNLRRVVCRADQTGIQRAESAPLDEAKVAVAVGGETHRATSDTQGVARVEVGKVSQKRAITFSIAVAGQDRDTNGLLRLRYGLPKEKLIDAGRYEVTSAPGGVSIEDVSGRMLDFLKATFHDDLGKFPRSFDTDRIGSLEYAPIPHFLHVVAWRLARQAKDKDWAAAFMSCLPLDRLKTVAPAAQPLDDANAGALFESVEAVVGVALETGDPGWLRVAQQKAKDTLAPAPHGWSERTARRCLALWRLSELGRDQPLEVLARRETDSLVRMITSSFEPTELVVTKKRTTEIPASGAPASHAWAALALFKGFEMVGEPSYKATALSQVQHLLEKHVEHGALGFSHVQKGEKPGSIHSTLNVEGAYPEAAACTHALLEAFHHTHERSYSEQALAIRAKVLGYWRKEYGGFGKVDYWEGAGAGEGKEAKSQLRPLALKKQASIYQQPWALTVFMPTFYPYWGEACREEKGSRGLLDFLFHKRD